MSIKRYVASQDTTITDAYKENLIVRAETSNMGASDSLEIFSLYGQVTTASLERSRILIKFPLTSVNTDRASGLLPASGNVDFFLKLYNAEHPFSLPKNYHLAAYPLSSSWEEGYGLDMEGYTDPGYGENNGYGTNWKFRTTSNLGDVAWLVTGSDYFTSSYESSMQYFDNGVEDLEINITKYVEDVLSGTLVDNGLVIKLSGSYEDGTLYKSFYTKKFFARGSQYFFKRPIIEARWDSSINDDRTNFYAASNLLSSNDNTQNLYFYNRFNGKLKNIPGNPSVAVKFYADADKTQEVIPTSITVTNPLTGTYKASVILDTTASYLYDFWVSSSSPSTVFFSSSLDIYQFSAKDYNSDEEYIFTPINLKTKYGKDEVAKIKIFSRLRDWSPNIYSVASKTIENTPIKNLYYKIFRLDDGYVVFDYSTGSIGHTKTSYDSENNYFSFDTKMLEPDYGYALQFARWDGTSLEEYKQIYKFRVE